MSLVRANTSNPPTEEEKRRALDIVLGSRTFARAEQLRALLQYLCKAEAEGQHKGLSEYVIGREVLGRPEDFSPIEDSSVRTRVYELRHKLEKLYLLEVPEEPLRIVLPKGTYFPQYERVSQAEATAVPATANDAHSETKRLSAEGTSRTRWIWWVLALSTLLGLGGIFALVSSWGVRQQAVDPIVKEAWGPLAQPDANVLICVATPLHLTVGPDTHRAFGSPIYPAPDEAYPIWRQHRPLAPEAKLGMVFSDNLIGFGTMNSILVAVNTLRRMGVSYQILPERVAPISTFRNRNVMLFGAPVDSDAITRSHESTPLVVDYEPSVQEFVIRDRKSGKMIVPQKNEQGEFRAVYGLITVLNTRDSDRGKLGMVMFSGITSAGTHGAAEYFASARALQDLRARFAREGVTRFPSAYQVVVRCTFSDMLLLSYECVEYRILEQ
jgi:hypothetical protein